MRYFLVPIVSSFLFLFPLLSLSHGEESGIFITEEVQLRLGDAFLEEGEYYRAITEYKKFRILFPSSVKGDYALFRTGIAFYLGAEYADAVRSFGVLRESRPDSGYADASLFFEGLSRWRKKDYTGAAENFDLLIRRDAPSPFAPRAHAAKALLEVDRGDITAARGDLEGFLVAYPGHPGEARVREALPLLREYEDLPEKSELLAGILSAILPGSGYVYAGRYGDGLTAFLLNGLFIAGTVAAVHNEWYPAAGLSGGIGLPFYLGNIYGSANAAKRWNINVRRELRGRIAASLDPVIDPRGIPAQ
ncbi:MAG TPA: tetratricopeptide repeat protein [Geobacteraceae bacterium]|nr:tetratricopeptide repeat protein [Geobacteraceae bacterium]